MVGVVAGGGSHSRSRSRAPAAVTDLQNHRIRRESVLGGLIHEYLHLA
jgi:hypothetical protein